MKRNLVEFGFSGWMADFGEYIPVEARFHDGRTGEQVHNEFPVLWQNSIGRLSRRRVALEN